MAASYVATRNACKLCAPLGACLAMRGVEGAVPFLHGSQGCATYIRRYLISHFREPMDIAASNFSEASTIFGGGESLKTGLRNVTTQYQPSLIGVATTCLAETIGEDVGMLVSDYRRAVPDSPPLVSVSTPSYKGTHVDGFHQAVRALVASLAGPEGSRTQAVNLFPGMVSPADLRHLKEILADFQLPALVLPDYSETLDGPILDHYEKIPAGGAPLEAIRNAGLAAASVELGRTLCRTATAAAWLQEFRGAPRLNLGWPVGVHETDRFFKLLEELSGRPTPAHHLAERGRLVDSYVDGHKYVFGKRAVVYGEEDLVVALTALLSEVGVDSVLCASGGQSGVLAEALNAVTETPPAIIREGADFETIAELARGLEPDFLIGGSKGYRLSRELNAPLIRAGFPIHDRIGGQRLLHLGYRGAQRLFDEIVNTMIARKQESSPVGYSYM